MPFDEYGHGVNSAAAAYGVKQADAGEDNTRRNALMAGAAAAPWAGLIGQQRMLHADAGPIKSHRRVLKGLKPGDVVLMGSPSSGATKGLISVGTGTPKGYHVAVVGRNGRLYDSHPSYGFSEVGKPDASQRIQVLRSDMSASQRKQFLKELDTYAGASRKYESGISRRLPRHLKDFAEDGRATLYDEGGGIVSGIKDLFLPKLRSAKSNEASRAASSQARKEFARTVDTHSKNMAAQIAEQGAAAETALLRDAPGPLATLGDELGRLPFVGGAFQKMRGQIGRKTLKSSVPACARGYCSNVPAAFLPFDVVAGKSHRDIVPSDYLRSNRFTSVGRYDPLHGATPLHEKVLKHGPTLARLGVGAGLAGLVYAGDKYLKAKKEREGADAAPVPRG